MVEEGLAGERAGRVNVNGVGAMVVVGFLAGDLGGGGGGRDVEGAAAEEGGGAGGAGSCNVNTGSGIEGLKLNGLGVSSAGVCCDCCCW